jgi:hypothetical protein
MYNNNKESIPPRHIFVPGNDDEVEVVMSVTSSLSSTTQRPTSSKFHRFMDDKRHRSIQNENLPRQVIVDTIRSPRESASSPNQFPQSPKFRKFMEKKRQERDILRVKKMSGIQFELKNDATMSTACESNDSDGAKTSDQKRTLSLHAKKALVTKKLEGRTSYQPYRATLDDVSVISSRDISINPSRSSEPLPIDDLVDITSSFLSSLDNKVKRMIM